MPLRDHFRPPLDDMRHWEGLHATLPVMIVARLRHQLPRRYLAVPRVHSGSGAEYEVRAYDQKRGSRLVAAVEIVSPANKDRPEHRHSFVAKCAGLLQERVCVVIIDLVTTRTANLYSELLDQIDLSDPMLSPEPPPLYVATCRATKQEEMWFLETWLHPLHLGQPLPTVPLWVANDLAVPLELEESYEDSCDILNIP